MRYQLSSTFRLKDKLELKLPKSSYCSTQESRFLFSQIFEINWFISPWDASEFFSMLEDSVRSVAGDPEARASNLKRRERRASTARAPKSVALPSSSIQSTPAGTLAPPDPEAELSRVNSQSSKGTRLRAIMPPWMGKCFSRRLRGQIDNLLVMQCTD